VGWIYLSRDREQFWSHAKMVATFWVSDGSENKLSRQATIELYRQIFSVILVEKLRNTLGK
jgi:hypothetical protein